MGIFDYFSNQEKEIMGVPVSKFCADIYMMSAEEHYANLVPFFNNFMDTSSVTSKDLYPFMTRISIEDCIKQIFCYYYYIFNHYIFSKIKNTSDIDYPLFKNNYSKEVYKQIYSEKMLKEFLYDKEQIDVYSDDMIGEDRSNPQFYKNIIGYFRHVPENRNENIKSGYLIEEPIRIITSYLESSHIFTHKIADKTIENGIIYFFAYIFMRLRCLPSNPRRPVTEEENNIQFNSHYFDELFNIMVDNTYTQTTSIITTSEITL
tara:strand:- start:158 stop:943 length:786 start_codon:yes stop_codon:yes gene_type:complete